MKARAGMFRPGFTVESGGLAWDGHRLEVLARRFGTPLYVVSRRALSGAYARFTGAFQDQEIDARLFFPVKTNPVPDVVRCLVAEGAGVEVSSLLELRLVRDLGVAGRRITVCGTVKQDRFLEEAIACRPALIVVESAAELRRLEALARRDSPVHVALRVNPGLRPRRLDLTVTMGTKASPAGFRPGSREWREALEALRSSPRLTLRGLHCHIGTGIPHGRPYREALDVILRYWVELQRSGFRPTVLDIGGGFHTPSVRTLGLWEAARLLGWGKAPAAPDHRTDGRGSDQSGDGAGDRLVREVAALCRERFDRLTRMEVGGRSLEAPRLFVEPGRSLSGSTQLLLLGVERVVDRGRHRAFVLCDGGAMSLSLLLLSEYHDIVAVQKAGRAPARTYDLHGSTPASLDIVGPGRKLPALEPGDVLAVLDVGAYFTSLGNSFGGPRPAIVILDGGDARPIRRREAYEDVFARDAFFSGRPPAVKQAVTELPVGGRSAGGTIGKLSADPAPVRLPEREPGRTPGRTPPSGEGVTAMVRVTRTGNRRAHVGAVPGSRLGAVVERAREAQVDWAGRTPGARAHALCSVRHRLVEVQREVAETVAEETNRPVTEVAIQEITATLGMLAFCEKHYPSWLRPRRFRYPRPGFWTKANAIHYDPVGVLAVIGPSNFPFSLPVMQACAALLCGNGVVLKPSERCPRTADLIRALYDESDVPEGIVEVVEGGEGEAERLIAHAGIAKVLFTGSSETGARAAELCGRHFKPCVLELGGDGPAIVCAPIDLVAVARGILWSTLYANGTSCIGTRRILAPPGFREPLLDALQTHARALSRGDPLDPGADLVPPQELRLRTSPRGADPADARSLQVEEYSSVDQAVEAVNRSAYGLSASVWCSNRSTARSIARRLQVGMVWINDASAAMPRFPWGGARRSGWGRLFGREALPELTNLKVISHDRRRRSRPKFWWFPYSSGKLELTLAVCTLAFGRRGWRAIPTVLKAARRHLANR